MHALRLLKGLALLALACTLCASWSYAQSGVTVQLFQPPPNQLKIADMWRIKLVNNTQNTYTVCLFGTLEETGIGKLLVDATTARFTLPPGMKIVSGSEIQPIDANYYDDRYKNIFLRTGQAPAGEYRICVEVRLDCGAQVLGRDCKDVRVQPVTPPILVSPMNESEVEERLPMFSWLPPAPLRSGQRPQYQLRVVEVLGRQSPFDAMQSNPAWFERTPISTTVFQYPISARQFVPGNTYAWMIKASSEGFPLGESEIWWFRYAKTSRLDDGDDPTRRGRDSGTVRYIGDRGGTDKLPFTRGNKGISLFNPEGDVRVVFGDPMVLADPTRVMKEPLYKIDDLKAKQNEMLEVIKELLRSCNE